MSHPCVACRLRFASTGELVDHVRSEHSDRLDVVPTGRAAPRRNSLIAGSYSRAALLSQLLDPAPDRADRADDRPA